MPVRQRARRCNGKGVVTTAAYTVSFGCGSICHHFLCCSWQGRRRIPRHSMMSLMGSSWFPGRRPHGIGRHCPPHHRQGMRRTFRYSMSRHLSSMLRGFRMQHGTGRQFREHIRQGRIRSDPDSMMTLRCRKSLRCHTRRGRSRPAQALRHTGMQ